MSVVLHSFCGFKTGLIFWHWPAIIVSCALLVILRVSIEVPSSSMRVFFVLISNLFIRILYLYLVVYLCEIVRNITVQKMLGDSSDWSEQRREIVSVHGGGWRIKIAHRSSSASCSTETALPPPFPVTQAISQSGATSAPSHEATCSQTFLHERTYCILLKGPAPFSTFRCEWCHWHYLFPSATVLILKHLWYKNDARKLCWLCLASQWLIDVSIACQGQVKGWCRPDQPF